MTDKSERDCRKAAREQERLAKRGRKDEQLFREALSTALHWVLYTEHGSPVLKKRKAKLVAIRDELIEADQAERNA